MRKLLIFLLSISTVFSLASCDFIIDKINGVEETDENNIQNSVQDDTPSSDEKPKQEDTTPSGDNPTPTGDDDEGNLD